MIRTLIAPTLTAALGLLVAACEPTAQREIEATAEAAALPAGEPVPDAYDWHVLAHGGSADLDFGDGDWAEGVSLFHLSCLPGSERVEMSWGYPGDAVLTSQTATGTFKADARVPMDHPVFAALRSSGSLAVGLSGADMTLTAKPAGREQIEAFFEYCDTGLEPRVEAATVPFEGQTGTVEATAPEAAASETPAERPAAEPAPVPAT